MLPAGILAHYAIMVEQLRASLQQIGPNVYAWIGAGGDSNAGAVASADGIVLVDAQQTLALARQFRGAVERAASRPIGRLINTHLHLDHTAGNLVFTDVPILAHERTLEMMEEHLGASVDGTWSISALEPKLRLFFGSNIRDLVLPGSPDETWFVKRMTGPDYDTITLKQPTETFADRFASQVSVDRLRVEYWGPSHCEGHVVVWLEKAKIAFLGDLLFVGRFPWLGDCDLEGWVEQLGRILTMDIQTVVPGHGPVATLKEVAEFRELLVDLRDVVRGGIRAGCSEEAAADELELPRYAAMPRYREWMRFNVRAIYRYLTAR